LESLLKEPFGEGSRNVAAVPKKLATQVLHHFRNRCSIIDPARS
jgi:hypothetical protein